MVGGMERMAKHRLGMPRAFRDSHRGSNRAVDGGGEFFLLGTQLGHIKYCNTMASDPGSLKPNQEAVFSPNDLVLWPSFTSSVHSAFPPAGLSASRCEPCCCFDNRVNVFREVQGPG